MAQRTTLANVSHLGLVLDKDRFREFVIPCGARPADLPSRSHSLIALLVVRALPIWDGELEFGAGRASACATDPLRPKKPRRLTPAGPRGHKEASELRAVRLRAIIPGLSPSNPGELLMGVQARARMQPPTSGAT